MATQRDVRDWADSRGFGYGRYERLPVALIEAYNAAHPDDPAPVPRGFAPTLEQRRESGRRGAAARHKTSTPEAT